MSIAQYIKGFSLLGLQFFNINYVNKTLNTMFFKREKKSTVITAVKTNIVRSRFRNYEKNKIQFADLFESLMYAVTRIGDDRKNKFMYDLINDNGFFEIGCYYLSRTNLHLWMRESNEQENISKLILPFIKLFSNALNKPEDEIADLFDDRYAIYSKLFNKSEIGIKNLIHFVKYSESIKNNIIFNNDYPPSIIIDGNDDSILIMFYNAEEHIMKAYLETVDKVLEQISL